jgi:hypothetical protein
MNRIKIELRDCGIGDDCDFATQTCLLEQITGRGQNPIANVDRIGAVSEVYR